MLRFAFVAFLASALFTLLQGTTARVISFFFKLMFSIQGAPVNEKQELTPTLVYQTLQEWKNIEKGLITCGFCNDVVNDVFTGFQNGQSDEEICAAIGNRCERLNIYNYKVCHGTALIVMVLTATACWKSLVYHNERLT